MDWKQYEKEIHELFASEYPEAQISHNASVDGALSKVSRQIDVLIEDYVAGNRIRIVVDGKYYSEKIDVKQVDEFIGMLQDVRAHKGLLITSKGYTPAAINRAYNDSIDVEVDILNFEELKQFQGHGAIPYSGNHGVLLGSPFGWVIDATRREGIVASLYQRGLSLEKAAERKEWMYINFWDKLKDSQKLDDLLRIQEANIKEMDSNASIKYLPTIKRDDAEVRLRVAEVTHYPTAEYTGFVSFDDFIFFCVMFTPVELSKMNVRKLENIIRTVRPIKIKHKL